VEDAAWIDRDLDTRREEDGEDKIQQRRLGFEEKNTNGTGRGWMRKGEKKPPLPLPLHGRKADPP
jgi:hypothetical protein